MKRYGYHAEYSITDLDKINQQCAHSDSDVGFIISTLSTLFQCIDGAVVVIRVNKRNVRKTDVWVGVNFAHKIVVRLVDLNVDLIAAQELWLVYNQ